MTDLVTAMILQARSHGVVGNCIRMAPMDVRKMADEQNWFDATDKVYRPALQVNTNKPSMMYWTLRSGYNFLGYQVQVDLSMIPGQPTLGAVDKNYQRSN